MKYIDYCYVGLGLNILEVSVEYLDDTYMITELKNMLIIY